MRPMRSGRARRLLLGLRLGDRHRMARPSWASISLCFIRVASAGLDGRAGAVVIKVWDGINESFVGWLSDHTEPWVRAALDCLEWCRFGLAMAAPTVGAAGQPLAEVRLLRGDRPLSKGLFTCVNLPYSAPSPASSPSNTALAPG